MSESVSRYAVILGTPENLQVPVLAKILAAFRKIPFQDAAHMARISWGFIGENINEKEAQELSARLGEAGIGSIVIPQNAIQTLPEARQVTRLQLSSNEIRATTRSDGTDIITQNRLVILSAASIKEVTTKTVKVKEGPTAAQKAVKLGIMMTTGIPLPIGSKKREIQKKETSSELLFTIDLITKDPIIRYRINAQDLEFSFLKERMKNNLLLNFKTLLADIAQIYPQASKNKGSRVILGNKPLFTMGYETLADFERESQWLWTLACHSKT